MSGKCFVDTNILIYAHDTSAGPKHDRARELIERIWEERTGVLSVQVLQELCVNLSRKAGRPPPPRVVREIVTDYLTWDVQPITAESVLQALDLQERYRISFWDALIVQAAEAAGATVLFSEDLSDGQVYGNVRVVNPLR